MCDVTGASAENACCVLYKFTLQSNASPRLVSLTLPGQEKLVNIALFTRSIFLVVGSPAQSASKYPVMLKKTSHKPSDFDGRIVR